TFHIPTFQGMSGPLAPAATCISNSPTPPRPFNSGAWFLDDVSVTAVPALQLSAAVSRKTHGGAGDFDIDLPLAGEPGVECRSGGAIGNHTFVFSFTNNVMNGNASVTMG